MNWPEEIWCDTDLVGDDEPHEGWQRYVKAADEPTARELIVNIRQGVPSKCDFCGKETPAHDLHPEEAGDWICKSCINADPQSYFGKPVCMRCGQTDPCACEPSPYKRNC